MGSPESLATSLFKKSSTMPRYRLFPAILLSFLTGHGAFALDIPLDQVVLQLPKWSAMPDRHGESGSEKCAKSGDGKIQVNAWTSSNPKATVEQGVVFFILPLVSSEADLKTCADTMKISTLDVDLIVGMAKSSNYPVGSLNSKIKQVGVLESGARKIYYVLSKPNERGDATLYIVTQGRSPQTANTAVFYGPPEALANPAAFAKMFRDSPR
jgi:hypothetical protein